MLDKNLSETFGEITWKYKIDELVDKLFSLLNEIINKRGCYDLRTIYLSNELLETLKILKSCTSCKDNMGKCNLDGFHKEIINELENWLAELEKEKEEQGRRKIINELNYKLIKVDDELSREVLCRSCKEKEVKMK